MNENKDFSDYEMRIMRLVVVWHQHPSFFSRALAALGTPVEKLILSLPEWGRTQISGAVNEGLKNCLDLSRQTFDAPNIWRKLARKAGMTQIKRFDDIPLEILDEQAKGYGMSNRLPVILSGVATGLIGLPGAIIDIPASITIFFRNIQTVCACYGIDPSDPSNVPYYMWLMTSGSPAPEDDSTDTGYIMTRLGLGLMVKEAQEFIVSAAGKDLARTIAKESSPVLIKLINKLLQRLGIQMTEKVAATVVPLVGAIAAAGINTAFSRDIHMNACMAGRTKYLCEKYGESRVRGLLTEPSRLYLPGAHLHKPPEEPPPVKQD
ncbi:MAG: EcsC family protein [Pseudomonadota bacterium]